MTADLLFLAEELDETIFLLFGVFVRVGAAVFLLPGLGNRGTPARIKLAGALALTAAVAPAAMAVAPPAPGDALGLTLMFGAEAATGLIFGLSIRFMIFALQIAGTVAAQNLSVSQMFGGMGGESQPAIANFLMLAGVALAMTAGLHVKVVVALVESYAVAPFGVFLPGGDMAEWTTARGLSAFELGVGLALPFVLVGFLYNLALGFINRAMPQLMVVLIGAPFITGAGLALLFLSAVPILMLWIDRLDMVLLDPFGMGR